MPYEIGEVFSCAWAAAGPRGVGGDRKRLGPLCHGLDLPGQRLGARSLPADRARTAGLGHFRACSPLLILGRDRQGYEDRRAADGGQFGNGPGRDSPHFNSSR